MFCEPERREPYVADVLSSLRFLGRRRDPGGPQLEKRSTTHANAGDNERARIVVVVEMHRRRLSLREQ